LHHTPKPSPAQPVPPDEKHPQKGEVGGGLEFGVHLGIFFYEAGWIATIEHRCVAHLY